VGGVENRKVAAHFEALASQSSINTIRGIGRAVYTLFNVPNHDSSLYEDLAKTLVDEPQPAQPSVEEEVSAILNGPSSLVDPTIRPTLSTKHLLGHMGVFMQFTSYLPRLGPYAETPFQHVDDLYTQLVERGRIAPLSFSDQLTTALEQTTGDLPEALWRLFITSRQHARWFDSSVITGMPEFGRDEIMNRMYNFSRAVAACKPHDTSPVQDTSGDTYYGWTHAAAGLVFGALATKQTMFTKAGGKAIRNGTSLMHSLAHRFKAQRLPSDHTIAAEYGNAMGDVFIQLMSRVTSGEG